MHLHRTALAGVILIELAPIGDERGSLQRTVCSEFLAAHGLVTTFVQCNLVQSTRRGTLRGLHFQRQPHAETKLVHCIRGRLFDVVVDLRKDSPTYATQVSVPLAGERPQVLYVPEGCAHGYQTLDDDVSVYYHMSRPYMPAAEGRVRWDDPRLNIAWPVAQPLLSPRDRDAADFVW